MSRESTPRNGRRILGSSQAGSAVARNTGWNLLGAGLPVLLALVTVPVLIHSIGTARFGVLTIAWVILGYFGLFDLGLGRATIKFLAEAFEQNRLADGRALFWTSVLLNGILGLVGALVLAAVAPVLVGSILNIPSGIQPEALAAFYIMASAVPLLTLTSVLRGALEARHRFGLLNALQFPTSTLTQAAPLLILPFSNHLSWLVGGIVFSRLVGAGVFFVAAVRQFESPFRGPMFLRKQLRPLFSYGGWLTVTNVLGPLMVYADRFVIGSLSSMSAVAYYATPYEAVTRLWILPQSLTRTVFPIFSARVNVEEQSHIYANAARYLTIILVPIVATVIVFASDLLRLWVGEEFAKNSTLALQILIIGVLLNSLAMLPSTLIQGLGRPDVTAKFHLMELPFYLILLWYGVRYWGVAGAAFAWSVRAGVDALLLAFYAHLKNHVVSTSTMSPLRFALLSGPLWVGGGWVLHLSIEEFALKAGIWGAVISVVVFGSWRKLLTVKERAVLVGYGSKALLRATSGRWPSK